MAPEASSHSQASAFGARVWGVRIPWSGSPTTTGTAPGPVSQRFSTERGGCTCVAPEASNQSRSSAFKATRLRGFESPRSCVTADLGHRWISDAHPDLLTERGGFEPPKRLPVYAISSRVPSAARTSLQKPLLMKAGTSLDLDSSVVFATVWNLEDGESGGGSQETLVFPEQVSVRLVHTL